MSDDGRPNFAKLLRQIAEQPADLVQNILRAAADEIERLTRPTWIELTIHDSGEKIPLRLENVRRFYGLHGKTIVVVGERAEIAVCETKDQVARMVGADSPLRAADLDDG